jgi:hypothetical protein
VRQRLAAAFSREQILDYLKLRLKASTRTGGRPEIDGSVMKVLWSEGRRARAELGVALLGAGGALHDEWPTQLLEQFSSTIGGGNAAALGCADLVALARTLGRSEDPVVRQRLAAAFSREQILDYLKLRLKASARTGGRSEIDGSVMKVLWSEGRRARAELGVALLGAGGALHAEWPTQLLEQFSSTIGGGTNEVHRTMIGERVLGLPPEPRVDRDVSYRELVGRHA